MRIENKYIRNRRFRVNAWKRARATRNPYEHTEDSWYWSHEDRIKSHFETIEKDARCFDKGHHNRFHASSSFRRELNKQRKAAERCAINKIRLGDYDTEVPKFKPDADWLYF